MKKLLPVLTIALLLASCGNTRKTNSDANRQDQTKTEEMKTIQLTKDDFLKKVMDYQNNPQEWKYLGDKPAIIDFYADWCGPCKMISPILEELAAEYDGQIYIYKVNTEQEQELAGAFGIRSIPTLLFVPMEGEPQIARGAMPKDSFKEAIDNVLLNGQ